MAKPLPEIAKCKCGGTPTLDRIKLGYSPLSQTIYLYRHGKEPNVALEKREIEAEIMSVLIEAMMDDAPNGTEIIGTYKGKQYRLRVTPVEEKP